MDSRLYIQAEPPPMWNIILMSIPSVILTVIAILLIIAAFTLFRDSDWVLKTESTVMAFVFGGVACWAWSETLGLYLRRYHYANIYIAVTDTDFIYQNYDAVGRLKKVKIPMKNIIKVEHLDVLTTYDGLTHEWQVYIQYRDERGEKRKLRINYEEIFPMQEGMRLIKALEK